jgi:alanine racemase
MTVVSRVTHLKTVAPGDALSYGRLWRSPSHSRVATVPLGYGDGFTRRLSGQGFLVGVGGAACPVVGAVCMDQCLVDVSAVPEVRVGDQVVIFGNREKGAIRDAAELGRMTGTISYEILTGIAKRVPRVVCGEKRA